MIIAVIIILILAIIGLIIYNMSIHKKIQTFKNINQKITSLNVLQDFMNVIGQDIPVQEKLKKINDTLIERYEIKYSTIVVFDGAEYVIKASNVDTKHWDSLKNLHTEEIFKDSISTTVPKYITIGKNVEKLPYQKVELARAKSAIFFPLYIDNVYVGYWIIESGVPNAFDNTDTTILEVVRENIVSVLKTVNYQNTIENIYRKDEFSGLYSAEYLYGKGKKTIDQYTTSAVCMFKITNLKQINDDYDRESGNKLITEISNIVKSSISSEYIFVRYMGPKFAIVFSGIDTEGVSNFVDGIKTRLEKIKIPYEDKGKKSKKSKVIVPKLNFVISTYYKGTGIEAITKKLEEYLDTVPEDECYINYI